MGCSYCREKQYPTTESKKRFGLCTFITPLSMLLPLLFDVPILLFFGIMLGTGILLLCVYPFTVQLSNREEALW
ncbi:hypothetical protein ACFSUM_05195 [Virgibacillus siamensis]|uniref:hypothetical protein n=1 Tax=Virgibacillus siamensis TaxID=480071 RepID=UPI0031D4D54F